VECYSGHTYAQEPRVVVWQGSRYPVERTEARWRTPDGPAFRVVVETGDQFDLHYLEMENRWLISARRSSSAAQNSLRGAIKGDPNQP